MDEGIWEVAGMIQAEIEYKDGSKEGRTFKDSGEYVRFINEHHEQIRIVTADNIRPVQLRQGKRDRKK